MTGTVSYAYKAAGCSAVVLVSRAGEEPLVLIPLTLPKEFDVDGLRIAFHFRLLRMPHREGCPPGNMVELTDVEKK